MNSSYTPVFSANVTRGPDGALRLAGHDVRDLAHQWGTPAYLLDEQDIRSRAREFREAFAEAFQAVGTSCEVYYAGKAFLCTAMARLVTQEGLRIDVASGGELAVAVRAGVPGERIALHGNNKSVAEIAAAFDARVGRMVVDSFEEIERVASEAERRGVRADVMLRVKSGVEAHTHEAIATAHEDQKFGFSLEHGQVGVAIERILARDSLSLLGFHSHIGSQIFVSEGFRLAAQRLIDLQLRVARDYGVTLPELDLGGGFGIAYLPTDQPLSARDMAAQLAQIVRAACEAAGMPLPRVSVEPGRAIVGPAGMTLYEVGTVKPVQVSDDLQRVYVSVDGGMSDNPRPALYDADYYCEIADRESDAAQVSSRVVGKHCESGDMVVRNVQLPQDIHPGDLLAVPATGAYCRSLASQYNHVPRPPVLAVREDRVTVWLRRETVEDLLALEGP